MRLALLEVTSQGPPTHMPVPASRYSPKPVSLVFRKTWVLSGNRDIRLNDKKIPVFGKPILTDDHHAPSTTTTLKQTTDNPLPSHAIRRVDTPIQSPAPRPRDTLRRYKYGVRYSVNLAAKSSVASTDQERPLPCRY